MFSAETTGTTKVNAHHYKKTTEAEKLIPIEAKELNIISEFSETINVETVQAMLNEVEDQMADIKQ